MIHGLKYLEDTACSRECLSVSWMSETHSIMLSKHTDTLSQHNVPDMYSEQILRTMREFQLHTSLYTVHALYFAKSVFKVLGCRTISMLGVIATDVQDDSTLHGATRFLHCD